MTALNRRLVLLLPLGIAGVAGVGLYSMLDRMRSGKFDPRGVPSALIGKPDGKTWCQKMWQAWLSVQYRRLEGNSPGWVSPQDNGQMKSYKPRW